MERIASQILAIRENEESARFHLDCGDVAGALRVLEEPWDGYREVVRLDLLDHTASQAKRRIA